MRRARAHFRPRPGTFVEWQASASRWRRFPTAICIAIAAEENGTTVRFWLYQKPDGKIATLFDACEICGSVGFYKGPNGVVCKNCAAPINPQSVGMPGGCNPIPLQASVTSDSVILSEADVAAALVTSSNSQCLL